MQVIPGRLDRFQSITAGLMVYLGLAIFSTSSAITLCASLYAQESEVGFRAVTSTDHFFEDTGLRQGFRHIDFDADETGATVQSDREFDIESMFAFQGARFACLKPDGKVVVSGYKFKRSLSRQRSIGNYFVDQTSGKRVMYKGAMRIGFCVPGEPDRAASVNGAGMVLEIVAPKHTVIEAYNYRGHRVGISWTTEHRSSFVGFDSPTAIAWLIVKGNDYLGPEVKHVNDDFAVDDLVFSEPRFDPNQNLEPTAVVVKNDGTRLTGHEAVLATPDLQRYHAAHNPDHAVRPESGVMAMLVDGSVLNCQVVEGGFELASTRGIIFPMNKVVGIWGAKRVAMYPNVEDFPDRDNVVLVSPMYRVSIKSPVIDFSSGKIQLSLDGASVTGQDEEESKRLSDDPDLLKQMLKTCQLEDMEAVDADNMLPVWLGDPAERDSVTGVVRTSDGIEYVLNGGAGFQLKGVTDSGVTIAIQDQSFEVPLDQIESFQMPPESGK